MRTLQEKSRHFGMDAEIQAMDGNQSVLQLLDSGYLPTCSFMYADSGTPVLTIRWT